MSTSKYCTKRTNPKNMKPNPKRIDWEETGTIITEEVVAKTMQTLKNRKAPGIDSICNLKYGSENLTAELTNNKKKCKWHRKSV